MTDAPKTVREFYCCGCEAETAARLTDGREIYPHRPDLASLPFWRCEHCLLHVGCHPKTRNPPRPLGVIPTRELRAARSHIHALLDPLWKSGRFDRAALYASISQRIGWPYHTASIRSLEDARTIYRIIREIGRAGTEACDDALGPDPAKPNVGPATG